MVAKSLKFPIYVTKFSNFLVELSVLIKSFEHPYTYEKLTLEDLSRPKKPQNNQNKKQKKYNAPANACSIAYIFKQ